MLLVGEYGAFLLPTDFLHCSTTARRIYRTATDGYLSPPALIYSHVLPGRMVVTPPVCIRAPVTLAVGGHPVAGLIKVMLHGVRL